MAPIKFDVCSIFCTVSLGDSCRCSDLTPFLVCFPNPLAAGSRMGPCGPSFYLNQCNVALREQFDTSLAQAEIILNSNGDNSWQGGFQFDPKTPLVFFLKLTACSVNKIGIFLFLFFSLPSVQVIASR